MLRVTQLKGQHAQEYQDSYTLVCAAADGRSSHHLTATHTQCNNPLALTDTGLLGREAHSKATIHPTHVLLCTGSCNTTLHAPSTCRHQTRTQRTLAVTPHSSIGCQGTRSCSQRQHSSAYCVTTVLFNNVSQAEPRHLPKTHNLHSTAHPHTRTAPAAATPPHQLFQPHT